MKRYWAVILTAATLVSCRSNQPATNPFMRTTVAPPGTTGVMVTPGQPYAQGISPPLVTQPAPVITTPAPVTTQPVPVVPGPPPAAPMTAPPSIAPQGDQFRYPGGSYIFHQSSNDPPPAVPDVGPDESPNTSPNRGNVQLASATMPANESPAASGVTQAASVERVAVEKTAYFEPTRVYVSGPMSQAPIIENPYVTAKNSPPASTASQPPQTLTPQPAAPFDAAQPLAAAQTQSHSQPASQPRTTAQPTAKPQALAQVNATKQPTAPTRITLGASRGDPPEGSTSFVPVASTSGSGGNTLRIVGESSPPTASSLVASKPTTQMSIAPPAPQPAATGSVMRVTAGTTTPAIRSTVETSAGAANLAIKTSPSGSTTARIVTPGDKSSEPDVIQTSFQPSKSNTTISISPPSR